MLYCAGPRKAILNGLRVAFCIAVTTGSKSERRHVIGPVIAGR
jgi:hypothetical protein